jgi:hypothetical protein
MKLSKIFFILGVIFQLGLVVARYPVQSTLGPIFFIVIAIFLKMEGE